MCCLLAEENMETKKDVFFHSKLYVLFLKAVSAGEHIFSSAIKGGLIATVISAARHWCCLYNSLFIRLESISQMQERDSTDLLIKDKKKNFDL